MRYFPITMILLLLLSMSALIWSVPFAKSDSGVLFSDDFSSDSGMWDYLGNAHRDSTNQYLVLTENAYWQGGVAFLRVPSTECFIANFSYRVGGGSGADGFVVFFYKQKYSDFGNGGRLAFEDPQAESIPGYGVEFDSHQNDGFPPGVPVDPSGNHIALVKDNVANHVLYVNDSRTEDNAWHNVSLGVNWSSVRVIVDESLVFDWNGPLDRTYDCFGFSAATGALTNWHLIDNFSISISGGPLSASISPPSASILVGQSITFTSAVSGGCTPYSYQWFLNGSAVSGATSSNWTFALQPIGNYSVFLNVTDSLGSIAKSNEASVIVVSQLTVSISPMSASILVGQSIQFTSTTSGGYPPYGYQWYLNSAPVSGATLSIWAFTPTTSGIYYIHVKVTDANGSIAQSDAARIMLAVVPVGGYSIQITGNSTNPLATHLTLIAVLAIAFTAIKRRTRKT